MSSSSTCVYVFQLPATVVWELSSILDPGNLWEQLAAVMPDVCDIDIDACRRLRTGERPTEALLRIWGTMGYKIIDLYKVLFKLKYVRCMELLLPFVDKKFHHYANSVGSSQSTPKSWISSQQQSVSAKTPEITKSSKHSSVVYSKRANSGSDILHNITNDNSNSESNSLLSGLQNTPSVKYEDVLQATNNFSPANILGRGGYGVVYKGVWKHLEVAVKRIQHKKDNSIEQQKERIRQSLQELRTLAKFRHDNILSLYGYSMDEAEPCLIYQFMSNGSLEDRLLCKNGTTPLTYSLKLSICKGVSCGLHFLHSVSNNPIIHGDVKSANILLDKHLEPKLGDFGLSRDGQIELSGEEKAPMIASHIKGTLAYLPPEFTTSKIITTKLDVFSFGVVLLEVATGQRAYSSTRQPSNLVDFSLKICSEKRSVSGSSLADERLPIPDELCDKRTPDSNSDDNVKIFNRLLNLGISCTQKDRFARPSFTEIFGSLSEVHS